MDVFREALSVMDELYGKDTAMPLATVNNGKANLRVVNAYYKGRAFYITTHALSNKMREIAANPSVAINHDLFVAHGLGENIGSPLDDKNKELREELRRVFCAFYDKHVNERDKNTCILKIKLTDALLFARDFKYLINFEDQTAIKQNCVIDIIF